MFCMPQVIMKTSCIYSSQNSRHGSSEVDCGQLGVAGDHLAEHGAVAGEEVDEALGEASLAEYLVDQIVGENGGVTRLPESHIALKIKY